MKESIGVLANGKTKRMRTPARENKGQNGSQEGERGKKRGKETRNTSVDMRGARKQGISEHCLGNETLLEGVSLSLLQITEDLPDQLSPEEKLRVFTGAAYLQQLASYLSPFTVSAITALCLTFRRGSKRIKGLFLS